MFSTICSQRYEYIKHIITLSGTDNSHKTMMNDTHVMNFLTHIENASTTANENNYTDN
jgi:hypothetical protein